MNEKKTDAQGKKAKAAGAEGKGGPKQKFLGSTSFFGDPMPMKLDEREVGGLLGDGYACRLNPRD